MPPSGLSCADVKLRPVRLKSQGEAMRVVCLSLEGRIFRVVESMKQLESGATANEQCDQCDLFKKVGCWRGFQLHGHRKSDDQQVGDFGDTVNVTRRPTLSCLL
jgi:hypothetical protein